MTEVTAVIPTKDRRDLLLRTLRTVLDQQDVDLKVVVVDDGGSDGTYQAVEALGDPRVMVVRHAQSCGVSAARNNGAAIASSPWIAFVDDDDLWAPAKLRSQLDALRGVRDARWSVTGAVHIDSAFRIHAWHPPLPTTDQADALLASNVVPGGGSGIVVGRDLMAETGGFDEAMANLADWDFAIRLALAAPVAPVTRPHIGYLVHQYGMAHNIDRSGLELDYLRVKYARQRVARGITLDERAWREYLAALAFKARRPSVGVRLRIAQAIDSRTLRPLVRTAADLAPVDFSPLHIRHASRTAPTGWAHEAHSWLDPIAAGAAA